MKPGTRAFLRSLDDFLYTADEATAEEVWAVLTALRGDDTGLESKSTSTGVIRQKALPRFGKKFQKDGIIHKVPAFFGGKVIRFTHTAIHFKDHTRLAAKVLGIPVAN